jgi:hypothetical protein
VVQPEGEHHDPHGELSLEQIDSLFGLDNAPDIKADPLS